MSLAIDAMQHRIIPGLIAVVGRPTPMTLTDLLGAQARLGYDLAFDDTAKMVSVDFRDPNTLLNAIASDSSRLARAAFQSMLMVPSDMERAETISWALIRTYYSAFYAAHAIVRVLGESYAYLDRSHCSQISSVASAMGSTPAFSIDAGLYRCVINTKGTGIDCTKHASGASGAHESFWSGLDQFFRALGLSILSGPLARADAQRVVVKLSEYDRCVRIGKTMSARLSTIRNELQYRQEHGAWMPCSIKKDQRERLGRLASQWRRDPMLVDLGTAQTAPLQRFVSACAFLASLCLSLFTRIAERSVTRAKSFATTGPLALLKGA